MDFVDPHQIPAFLRKAQLKKRLKHKKLILTALDRKRAGIVSPLLKRARKPRVIKATVPELATMSAEPKFEFQTQPSMQLEKSLAPGEKERARKKAIKRSIRKRAHMQAAEIKNTSHPIGVVTGYLDKIGVGVIRLSKRINKGDHLVFDNFEQTIDSMQINRKPVKRAEKDAEIGIKLDSVVRAGELVYKKR